jgi:hypothetical protein
MTAPKKVDRVALQNKLVAALKAREEAAKALESLDLPTLQKAFSRESLVVGDLQQELEDSYSGSIYDFDWGW